MRKVHKYRKLWPSLKLKKKKVQVGRVGEFSKYFKVAIIHLYKT